MKSLFVAMFLAVGALWAQESKYSLQEQVKFLYGDLDRMMDKVNAADFIYKEINKRIGEQNVLLKRRFGDKRIKVRPSFLYHPLSRYLSSFSEIIPPDQPRIIFFIPSIMDGYGNNPLFLLIMILHERDHLIVMKKANVAEEDKIILNLEDEIIALALTTEFITTPIKENYKGVKDLILPRGDENHYRAWVEAGRSEKSPVWRSYVKNMMSPVLK